MHCGPRLCIMPTVGQEGVGPMFEMFTRTTVHDEGLLPMRRILGQQRQELSNTKAAFATS